MNSLFFFQDPASPFTVRAQPIENFTQLVLDNTLTACPNLISHDNRCWWRNVYGLFVADGEALAPHRTTGPVRLYEESDLDLQTQLISEDNRTATMILMDTNNRFGGAGNKGEVSAWDNLQGAIDRWLAEEVTWAPERVSGGSYVGTVNGDHYSVGMTHEQMLLDASQKGMHPQTHGIAQRIERCSLSDNISPFVTFFSRF